MIHKVSIFWNCNFVPTQICMMCSAPTGVVSLGVLGVPWQTQILADQLTLFQPVGTDYAHLISTGTPGFSDLPTALRSLKISGCKR